MIPFSVWVIYDHPLDFPQHFVARRFEVNPGQLGATDDILLADSLDDLRDQLPFGLTLLGRSPGDDPAIVETWI